MLKFALSAIVLGDRVEKRGSVWPISEKWMWSLGALVCMVSRGEAEK